jgi:hypothetical protein
MAPKKRTRNRRSSTIHAQLTVSDPETARAEELTAAIVRELGGVKQAFWRIGEHLHEIAEKRLFLRLGFASFRAYVQARLECEVAQAHKMVRVVRAYFREDAEQMGLERAAALITYAKVAKTDPGLLVRENVQMGDTAVAEASKRDILAAAAALRRDQAKRTARAPAARSAKRVTEAIDHGLRRSLADGGLARPVSIRFDRRRREFVVRFALAPLAARFAPDLEPA